MQIAGCDVSQRCLRRPGSDRNRWGSYSAHLDLLSVIRVRGREEGEQKVGNGDGEEGEGREEGEGVGREGKGEGK